MGVQVILQHRLSLKDGREEEGAETGLRCHTAVCCPHGPEVHS